MSSLSNNSKKKNSPKNSKKSPKNANLKGRHKALPYRFGFELFLIGRYKKTQKKAKKYTTIEK